MSVLSIALFGVGFGAFVATSILLAHLAVTKFAYGNPSLDLVIRLGVFGVLILVAGEVIGFYYGRQIRHQAAWFWCGFTFGLVLVPLLVGVFGRLLSKKNLANSKRKKSDSD